MLSVAHVQVISIKHVVYAACYSYYQELILSSHHRQLASRFVIFTLKHLTIT